MRRFSELPPQWQRVFELSWESLRKGSKAIAAVITDPQGNIISEGRNRIGEDYLPNPAASHAETEAVRELDRARYPDVHSYILYAGLEPCIMCMGTLVMGGIRRVVIAARDDFGGAMGLLDKMQFLRNKNMSITWLDDELGDVQRAMQLLREVRVGTDPEKLERMMTDFAVYNRSGVEAARELMSLGWPGSGDLSGISAGAAYDIIAEKLK